MMFTANFYLTTTNYQKNVSHKISRSFLGIAQHMVANYRSPNWQLLQQFQPPKFFFTHHGNQNSRSLEHCIILIIIIIIAIVTIIIITTVTTTTLTINNINVALILFPTSMQLVKNQEQNCPEKVDIYLCLGGLTLLARDLNDGRDGSNTRAM